MSVTSGAQGKSVDAALLSIGFMMDTMERLQWRSGGGRGAWESCLAALVLALEPSCKTRRLLEALPSESDMDEVALLNAMAHLGYYSDTADIALGDVEQRLLPCLFVPRRASDVPIVILSRREDGLVLYHGARHEISIAAPDSVEARLRGEIRFFRPFDQNRQRMSKFMREGMGHSWFGAVVRRFSGTLWLILLICLVLNIFALAPSLFVMAVYDRVIAPADLGGLPFLTVGVGLALCAEHVLRDVRSHALSWMTGRLDNIVGARIFSHLISLPAELIEQASVASQVSRIKTFESVRDLFSSSVFLSFLEIPFVVIALGVMIAIAGPLACVPLVMIAGYIGVFVAVREKIKRVIRLAAKSSSIRQQFTIETLEKLRSVRTNGLTAVWGRKFGDLAAREILLGFDLGFLGTVAETLAHALTVLAAVLTVGFGAHLIWAGEMTTGALVASMILVWRILLPFYSLCTMIPRLEQLRNSVIQVNALMDMETEQDQARMSALPAVRGRITVESVTFGYEEGKDAVLEGLNFDAPAGKFVTVTGEAGAGKTSVLKLLKGLYRPQNGMVRIDGFDIRQLDARELRHHIAYVPQKADLFPGTVAENLLLGNPLATAEEIAHALDLADARDEIAALPDGLRTEIGRGGVSPALAARLSLARAYLMNAPVLLVDELPNAVLNGRAGVGLRSYLAEVHGKKTVIMVTHRNDFISGADLALYLRRGAPARTGIPSEITKMMREVA